MADQSTGTRDITYNLVSVIYHALQGAETYHTYVQDAEAEGDQELASFFREVQQQSSDTASRAKEMLTQRIGRGGSR